MGSQLLVDRWRRGISGIPAVGGLYVSEGLGTVRNVSDAIDNVLSPLDSLIEVLRLEKQTMLVVRLTTLAEVCRGIAKLAKSVLNYSLTPYIDVRSLRIEESEE